MLGQVKTLIQIDGLGAGWLTLAFATLTALLAACMIKQLQFLNEVGMQLNSNASVTQR